MGGMMTGRRSSRLKAVVTFAGARDGYQLPLALNEADLLEAFVTDMYWPADKPWFSSSLGKLLPQSIVSARYCQGLNSSKVKISSRAWAASACGYVAPQIRLSRYGDRSLGEEARAQSSRTSTALFCCSYYASEAFKPGEGRPPFRFLFQLHPHPKSVRKILSDEVRLVPLAAASLQAESELALSGKDFEDLSSEPHLANGWVVASRYTAQTLAEQGIPSDQIHIVPYGVDANAFVKRPNPPVSTEPFTVIYLGSLIQRKGLSYLLDAVRMLKSQSIRVVLCGRGVVDQPLIAHYADLNIDVQLGLSRNELVRQLHRADVFVLPSLAEGFGHVILEAMSCGLPVVATDHTCATDVISDGEHGFIVPIRVPEAIAEKLEWGITNRDELATMGEAAAQQARVFTWSRFRKGVREAYARMIATAQ
jgi:hypothetical protein